jgi:hypothetical protein
LGLKPIKKPFGVSRPNAVEVCRDDAHEVLGVKKRSEGLAVRLRPSSRALPRWGLVHWIELND